MRKKGKKAFDCVEMKRKAALSVFQETRGMSLQEREKYWREKHETFLLRQAERKGTTSSTTVS